MGFIKTIIISIVLIFSFSVSAQSSESTPAADPEKCGLTETGEIKRISYDICQEDIAFRSLYDIFPSFFDNYVFKIIKFKYISNIDNQNLSPTEEKNKYMYTNIFEKVFSTLSELSLIFILMIVLYHLIIGIIKSIDSGTFLVDEKERKSVYGSYLLGVFLALPIGNLLIIHVILLLIFILSIIPANLIFTFFLTGVLSGFSPNTDYDSMSENNPNYVISNTILDEFTKSKVCKFNSANYLLRNRIDDSGFNSNYNKYKTCFVPSNDIALENDASNEYENQSPFITYRAQNLPANKTDYSTTLIMGKLRSPKNCKLDDVKNFKCSSINITKIKETDSYIIQKIIGYERYKNSIKSLVPEISYPNEGNKNKIKSEFENLKLIIEEFDYENNIDFSGDDFEIKKPNVSELQHFSYLFHKDIMNALTIGLIEYQTNNKSNPKNTTIFKENDFLFSIQSNSTTLSHILKKIDCLQNFKLLKGTDNLVDGLKKNNMTTCLNPNNNSIFGTYIDPVKESQKYQEELEKLIKEYREKRNKYLENITNNRTYVMQSFDETIVDISNDFASNYNLKDSEENEEGFTPDSEGKNLKDVRKEGFMGYAGLITKTALISSNIPQYRDNILKNFTITPNYNNKLISRTIYDDSYEFNSDFNDILIESKILQETPEKVKENNSTQPSPKFNSERDFDQFFNVDMFKIIKDTFNINDILDKEKGYEELCIETPEDCPIPEINPISTINSIGSTYFKQGVMLVGLGVSAGLASSAINYFNTKKNFKNNTISGIGESDKVSKKERKLPNKLLDFIFFFMGILVFMGFICIIAGFVMMVAIPLLPFIYMLTAFIEWLILFLSILVISPIFVGYLFNYNENKEEIKSFLKNSILKILIKPTLLILSILFLYAFFYIIIFFINITLFSFLDSASNTKDMLGSFLSNIVYSFLYCFIIFVLLKWLFTTIDNFNQKTFSLLGMKTQGDKSQNDSLIGDLVQLSAYNSISDQLNKTSKQLSTGFNVTDRARKTEKQLEERSTSYQKVVSGNYEEGDNIFEYRKQLPNGEFKDEKINLDDLKGKPIDEREELWRNIVKSNPELYGEFKDEYKENKIIKVASNLKDKILNRNKK